PPCRPDIAASNSAKAGAPSPATSSRTMWRICGTSGTPPPSSRDSGEPTRKATESPTARRLASSSFLPRNALGIRLHRVWRGFRHDLQLHRDGPRQRLDLHGGAGRLAGAEGGVVDVVEGGEVGLHVDEE